ncbi:MAG: YitT family protein [Rubricella sp.]
MFHRSNESARLERDRFWASSPTHHAPWEDLQGILASIALTALAVSILQDLGLVIGGIAGLALTAHYITGLDTGLLFFLLNLPFYGLAILRMGWAFTIKTFASVAAFSALVTLQSQFIRYDYIDPIYGAVIGGLLIGFGLLGMFRHRATLGGVGILAVYLQDKLGIRAGLTQLVLDALIFAVALVTIDPILVAWSFLGAIVLNLFLAVNHRTDRYIAR